MVVLSAFVHDDLEGIADYIAQDSPARALGFIRKIREKFAAIGKNPLIYRLRPETGDDARIALVGRYPDRAHRVRCSRPTECLWWR